MGKPDVLKHNLSQEEAIKLVKKAIQGIPMGILSAKENVIKAGSPGMEVVVKVSNNEIVVDSKAFGVALKATVVTAIESKLDELPSQEVANTTPIQSVSSTMQTQVQKATTEPAVPQQTKATNSMEQRILFYLEDEIFEKAAEYCEKLLDEEPANATAYLGKLMLEFKFSKIEQLKEFFIQNKEEVICKSNYKRMMKCPGKFEYNYIFENNNPYKENVVENEQKSIEEKTEEIKTTEQPEVKEMQIMHESKNKLISFNGNNQKKEILNFGSQRNNTNAVDQIDWIVLEKNIDKILVISRLAIDYQSYNNNVEKVSWEKSFIRRWLNTEFLEYSFSSSERARIAKYENDSVFLLSVEEANKYFENDSKRICFISEYAKRKSGNPVNFGWWLKSVESKTNNPAYVSSEGEIKLLGYEPNMKLFVRPAMWIKL